jgi:hypothetical protein
MVSSGKARCDIMGNGYSQPSDYGPSFAFEIPTNILTKERFESAYTNAFEKYIIDFKKDSELPRRIWKSFDELKYTDIILELEPFNYVQHESINIHVISIPLNTNIKYMMEFYQSFPNDSKYDYVLIKIFKTYKHQQFLSTKTRCMAFHEILKVWIKELLPNFVWGDWFTTMKKEGENDSRLNVWAYNYYSKRLVDAIGMDRFRRLVETTKKWDLEEFNGGVILTGHPDPYSTTKKTREKANEMLQLEERLAGVIQKKVPVVPVHREPPPKGVIE